MKPSEIRNMPTRIVLTQGAHNGIHESVLRSYQTLQMVKSLLEQGCPASVLLWLIEDIESGEGGEHVVRV